MVTFLAILLLVDSQIANGATSTKTFVETFHSKKYRDAKTTTAVWDTVNFQGRLPKSSNLKVWTKIAGSSSFSPASIAARGDEWFVGGSTTGGATMLLHYKNGKYTNVTSQIPTTFSGAITAIADNGSYWLLGGSGQLLKYDGTSFTDISSPDFDTTLGAQSVNDIDWNGSYWLIGGSNSKVVSYDGTVFLDVTGLMSFGTGSVNTSWNGTEWLIAGFNGTAYTYNGLTSTLLSSPFGSSGNILSIASNGTQWLLGGFIGSQTALYMFDGSTFHNWSSLIPAGAFVYNVAWDSKNWIVSTYGGASSDRIWQINSDASSAKAYSYSGLNTVFEIDEFATTSNGWLFIGNNVNQGTTPIVVEYPTPYISKRQLQSKAVATFSKSWISSVKLEATKVRPFGTSITYYVSNNDGLTWKKTTSGKTITFSTKGSRLKWKAVLSTTLPYQTPVISQIKLTYKTKRL